MTKVLLPEIGVYIWTIPANISEGKHTKVYSKDKSKGYDGFIGIISHPESKGDLYYASPLNAKAYLDEPFEDLESAVRFINNYKN